MNILESPVPGQEEFWEKPRFNAGAVAGLERIRGFITALPVCWTENENLDFKLPTPILVKNDAPDGGARKPETGAATASVDIRPEEGENRG